MTDKTLAQTIEEASEEWTQEAIDEAIEEAEARADAAEAAAAAIADAALRDTLSREITQCRNDLIEMRGNLQALQTQIPEQLAAMETRLAALLAAQVPAPPLSIPPNSSEPPIPEPPPVNPAPTPPAKKENTQDDKADHKRRFR